MRPARKAVMAVAGSVLAAAALAGPQESAAGPGARTVAAAAQAVRTEPAEVTCPATLGHGVKTGRQFCDVVNSSNAAEGIIIKIPPHRGTAKLHFDLHNRHTYSEQQVRAGRAFARYTASTGVFLPDNTLLRRAVIDSEFRTEADLFDRVGGGAGPAGLKAVAPTGVESISVELPAGTSSVSIIGERLTMMTIDGTRVFSAPGVPIAVISNVVVEYTPAPVRKRAPAAGS